MEKIVEQSLLYDFYGDLLTEHQKDIYEGYVLENLSLAELAESSGISRQGVHDLIKRVENALQDYEKKLHLVEKFLNIKEEVQKIRKSDSLEQAQTIAEEILDIL
ncbi:MAG: YlxM family DNA-binding protein [Lachnospiraceae bacterium]|nr:YlxM family DNA-binding protein [Lachnospiraceae bacterium]MDO4529118.1 YlxM family DNA-binding protein [Lachnospiraceae bacterium]MDO4734418.1 YlxM family DNA-binding protein [Lachnospiraceae bacterium]